MVGYIADKENEHILVGRAENESYAYSGMTKKLKYIES